MKRSCMGFFLLVLLLLGGLLVTGQMVKIHDPIESKLQQAAQCSLKGDWDRAHVLFLEAQEDWEAWEHFRSCFADHDPVEEIDGEFELLKVFGGNREELSFAGGCRELARKVAAVGEAHELVWWNLF